VFSFVAGSFECRMISDVEHPEWTMAFDDDPAVSLATRHALLGEAATTGRVIAASHLRTAGTVERIAGGFRLYPFPAKA
jgi:hypothetical protein